MQYFGSNIVKGLAESWMEAEMSWVEVGGDGWSWLEVEMSWVEVDGAGWSWVGVDEVGWRMMHGLVIRIKF